MKGPVDMTGSEELLRQARSASQGDLPRSPRKNTAVIACIDARVEPNSILGGTQGDYHVIRNGGGLVTDDALRSLMVSQFYGTNQVIVMMHTDCAAMAYPAAAEKIRLEHETGERIGFDLHPFDSPEVELIQGVTRLRETPLLPYRDRIIGVLYDVDTRRLRTVVE